jgi:hypothetical protein
MPGQPGHSTAEPQNYFALGVQGAKDQDAGTFYFFKHLDGTGFDTTPEVASEREGGAGREINLNYKTMVHADGQVVAYARPDAAGRLLTYALGQDTPSLVATTGPLVRHTIVPGGSLPYLTADQTWSDESERTTNCLVSDLTIEGEAGKPLKMTAQFVSGGSPHVATTALSATRESGLPLMYPSASAWMTAAGALGAQASSIELTKFKIEIKNGIDDGIQTTGLNREDLVWLTAEFNVDGTLKYENNDVWDAINYGGGTQVPVALATGAFSCFVPHIPSGGSQNLLIGLPLLEYTAVKVNRLDPDGKTMYLDFTGMTTKSATNSIFAQVITGATTAYTATAT